jgi:hypothetical protein
VVGGTGREVEVRIERRRESRMILGTRGEDEVMDVIEMEGTKTDLMLVIGKEKVGEVTTTGADVYSPLSKD